MLGAWSWCRFKKKVLGELILNPDILSLSLSLSLSHTHMPLFPPPLSLFCMLPRAGSRVHSTLRGQKTVDLIKTEPNSKKHYQIFCAAYLSIPYYQYWSKNKHSKRKKSLMPRSRFRISQSCHFCVLFSILYFKREVGGFDLSLLGSEAQGVTTVPLARTIHNGHSYIRISDL